MASRSGNVATICTLQLNVQPSSPAKVRVSLARQLKEKLSRCRSWSRSRTLSVHTEILWLKSAFYGWLLIHISWFLCISKLNATDWLDVFFVSSFFFSLAVSAALRLCEERCHWPERLANTGWAGGLLLGGRARAWVLYGHIAIRESLSACHYQ